MNSRKQSSGNRTRTLHSVCAGTLLLVPILSLDTQHADALRDASPDAGRGGLVLDCATVSMAAGVDQATGSLMNVGQSVIGLGTGGTMIVRAGVIACLLDTRGPDGDFDGDGDVDLDDHAFFVDCLASPDTLPSPPSPLTPKDCMASFDFDIDSDVDFRDSSEFATLFTTGGTSNKGAGGHGAPPGRRRNGLTRLGVQE